MEAARDLERQPRLPDTADARQRDEQGVVERSTDARDVVLAPHERAERGWEVARRSVDRRERRELARETRGADLEQPVGARDVAQPVLTEIEELDAGQGLVLDEPGCCARAQDLTGVCDCHDARRSVHRGPEVVAVAQLGLATVQSHADAQWTGRLTPLVHDQRTLRVHRGEHTGVGRVEGGVDRRRRSI